MAAIGCRPRVGRLLRAADFERVLRTRSRAQTVHFAVHHLLDRPSVRRRPAANRPAARLVTDGLSTGWLGSTELPVDDSLRQSPLFAALERERVWLGAVIPKRHAKRSVTRTLLKRQIRAVIGAQQASLAEGLWVVRLRAPFDRQYFVSAASDALRRSARTELEQLLTSALPGSDRR